MVKDITDEKQAKLETEKTLEYLEESKQRYKSLFHHNSDAIFSLDLSGIVTNANTAVQQVTQYKRKELFGLSFSTLVVEKDQSTYHDLLNQAKDGETGFAQLRLINKVGETVTVSVKVTPLIIDGTLFGMYGILRDITDFVEAQKRLAESEERFRIITENAHDLISLIDDSGTIIYCSPSYQQILGFDNHEYEGNLFLHNIHPDDTSRINEVILKSINSGELFTVQFRQYNHEGDWVWSESNGTPVFDKHNRFKHLVVLTRDITIQKEYEERLEYFAHHDPLTGLPNRRYFRECLTEEVNKVSENQQRLAVMMMDIDHFKMINDTWGHDIGDWVIEEFGKRLQQSVREHDMVGRLGGDEFVILLPEVESELVAATIAQSIHQTMQRRWQKDGQTFEVTTSIGIALAPPGGATEFAILKCADNALYDAKEAGRNTYKIKEL
ncbi:sensor domain-containing protein [Aquibacillus sediminis]|uniref:sensor domain-containing protein n=1 Tax=Aquibacillus sediminis TaxID=2574734 RepID=UPI0011082E65|nr:diguanylate cyclase [Aquibacillus sediminis]